MNGRILKNISNDYLVEANNQIYNCKPRGILRKQNEKPLVGDLVEIDTQKLVIDKILPRKNFLIRPPVANVDYAVIVMSLVKPDFSSNLLDKLILVCEYQGIKPIICFTKIDLNKEDFSEIFDYYQRIGYPIFMNNKLEEFKEYIKDKIVVLAGQSGSGKSTLINMINPDLNLKTDIISKSLGRGKHTTRHTELWKIGNLYILDTPGFSAIDLKEIGTKNIKDYFIEFQQYRNDCQFSDCQHEKEEKCAVKEAIERKEILNSRYQNYLKFMKE
jgi:ribosome biogenesis GTPase